MTTARASFTEMLDVASNLNCVGVEVRNDLSGALFDGLSPQRARQMARDKNLRILALAEIKQFNYLTDQMLAEAAHLMQIAADSGAEAVSLIPRNDGHGTDSSLRQSNLKAALTALLPMLEFHNLVGLIEPLGFSNARCEVKKRQ